MTSGENSSQPPMHQAQAHAPESPATGRAVKAGRPVSLTMTRAVEALSKNPRITASELAVKLEVSASYARTLLRRARSRVAAGPPHEVLSSGEDTTLMDLQQRLTCMERDLAAVRALPVHARASLNLNRRADVLRLLGGGLPPESVAERLAIPQGEVEFIRKVDRILTSSV